MKDKLFYVIFFALLLAASRIIPHPPNFTPLIASAVIGPVLIKPKILGIFIPLLGMFISDLIIGFSLFQIIIYLTLMFIGYISNFTNNIVSLTLKGFIASLIFFFVTNLAVWFFWDFYTKDINGLVQCYTLALPFFKNTLISTLVFLWLFYFSRNVLENLNSKINEAFFFLRKIFTNNN